MVVIRWAALYGCTKPDGPHDRRDAGQRGSAPMQERQARTGRRSVEREWGGRRENIMQRTGLRLSQLEGWKAGRLLERNHEMRMETRRGYRGKGGERRSSRKVPGFLGRRQRPLTTRTSKEKKALPSVIIKRCSSHSAWRRAERAKEAAGQVQHSVQHQLCPGSPATLASTGSLAPSHARSLPGLPCHA